MAQFGRLRPKRLPMADCRFPGPPRPFHPTEEILAHIARFPFRTRRICEGDTGSLRTQAVSSIGCCSRRARTILLAMIMWSLCAFNDEADSRDLADAYAWSRTSMAEHQPRKPQAASQDLVLRLVNVRLSRTNGRRGTIGAFPHPSPPTAKDDRRRNQDFLVSHPPSIDRFCFRTQATHEIMTRDGAFQFECSQRLVLAGNLFAPSGAQILASQSGHDAVPGAADAGIHDSHQDDPDGRAGVVKRETSGSTCPTPNLGDRFRA